MTNVPHSSQLVLVLLIVTGTLIRIPQLWHGLNEMHAFRQTQTAYVALEYARHGINLLHTPVPIFGPNTDIPMELPLVQGLAALLIRCGVGPDSAVRVIGLVSFQIAAVLLVVLMARWHGRVPALVAAALFEFSPFALAWGAASLVDFPSVALSLGMVVGLDRWFQSASRVGLISGAMCAWLAFLVKATTPPSWCLLVLVSAGAAYVTVRSWRRVAIGLLAGPAVGLLLGSLWTWYADCVKDADPLTQFQTSSRLNAWNFGTAGQRLDPHTYAEILLRIGFEIAGPLGLGLLIAVVGIVLSPAGTERARRAGWLGASVFNPLIFFNLYVVHNYYLIGILPAVVAAVGLGIAALAERSRWDTAKIAAVGTAVVLIGSRVSLYSQLDVRQWLVSPRNPPEAKAIQSETAPDDLLILVGCYGWDPEELYFADRRGLMLWSRTPDDVWSHRNIGDYRFLYTCDPPRDPTQYFPPSHFLPPGYSLVPTRVPGLSRIVH